MYLPLIVILLLFLSLYLSFQKNLDTTNKVIIICIALVIFNISLNYIRNIHSIKEKHKENFQNNVSDEGNNVLDNLEEQAEEIVIKAPQYGDEDDDEDDNEDDDDEYDDYDDDDFKNTRIPKRLTKDRFNNIENDLYEGVFEEEYENGLNIGETIEKMKDTTISQSHVDGTGNVFNPQIIIKDGNVGVRSSPQEEIQTVYRQSQDWQMPANELYEDNTSYDDVIGSARNVRGTTKTGPIIGTPKYEDSDPWETLHRNAKASYEQSIQDRNKCGSVSRPFKERETEIRQSSPFIEGSDVVNQLNTSRRSMNARKVESRGYTYKPPNEWDIPKYIPSCTTKKCIRPKGVFGSGVPEDVIKVCSPQNDDCDAPDGVFTSGSDLNMLELDENGDMLLSENKLKLTNVGSILPKFIYKEM